MNRPPPALVNERPRRSAERFQNCWKISDKYYIRFSMKNQLLIRTLRKGKNAPLYMGGKIPAAKEGRHRGGIGRSAPQAIWRKRRLPRDMCCFNPLPLVSKEGMRAALDDVWEKAFQPTPSAGRMTAAKLLKNHLTFQPTPSAWRVTEKSAVHRQYHNISTRAPFRKGRPAAGS